MAGSSQLQRILALVDRVLGDQVLGAYRHGSAVLGGLRPTSDLDVLVVTAQRMTESQRRSLLAGLLEVSTHCADPPLVRPVELTVAVLGDIKPWRYPPRREYMYGEWLRDAYENGAVPHPEVAPDLSVLLTMVLDGDAALVGPPARRLLDPVPREDLIRGATAGIPQLLGDLDSDTRNVLLTLARIWMTLETGQIGSKDAAADWVLVRAPLHLCPVLARARDMYRHGTDEKCRLDLDAAREHAEFVVGAIRDALPPPERTHPDMVNRATGEA